MKTKDWVSFNNAERPDGRVYEHGYLGGMTMTIREAKDRVTDESGQPFPDEFWERPLGVIP